MTTFTQTELATRVMRDLGLTGSEEVLSAADLEFVSETTESGVALLSSLGIPIWNGSEISVPVEYLMILSRYLGLWVSVAFGMMSQTDAMAAMRLAEQQLTVLANPRGGDPLTLRTDESRRRRGRFNFSTGQ